MRDSTIIYRSFYEAIVTLSKINQAEVWQAVFEYSLNFKEVELAGHSKAIFLLIKPQLDANNKRYQNGSKPKAKGKQDISEQEAKQEQSESEPQANKNVNKNDNVNDNSFDIWKTDCYTLKQDERWWTEAILMKVKLPADKLDYHLEQYWLSLQKANFTGELKQVRAGFQKWLNTVIANTPQQTTLPVTPIKRPKLPEEKTDEDFSSVIEYIDYRLMHNLPIEDSLKEHLIKHNLEFRPHYTNHLKFMQ